MRVLITGGAGIGIVFQLTAPRVYDALRRRRLQRAGLGLPRTGW